MLTVRGDGLYRTKAFKSPSYVGDPINSVKLFNDKEVDELVVLDITGGEWSDEDFKKFEELAKYAFMPLAYGGRLSKLEHVARVFKAGYEKVILNTGAHLDYSLVSKVANVYGSQSVIVSIDVKRSFFKKRQKLVVSNGKRSLKMTHIDAAIAAERAGAGEIIIRSVDDDGLMEGYDISLIKELKRKVSIPIVAAGGAGSLKHFQEAIENGAHSVAAGSMFVYQGKHRAVLINYPSREVLKENSLIYRK
ncbi:HisA/HisF-related TIM barrel protein [Vibrio coralliilyticus]|uniref:HisA/HisF-related TIM barrel protein n=1 Tax=Vibrio coralliilyticus TaxID=190893 RepID=UPI001C278045|nr:HisA/HisF-related TIM barrel protein [Vibrio coralliilyticus]